MDDPEKLATFGTQDTSRKKQEKKTQHIMRWIPLYANNHHK